MDESITPRPRNEVEESHARMVRRLVKPGSAIRDSLSPAGVDLWHMATGVAGEAGELLDAVKKNVVYNKPLDFLNIVEELGDLEFYMEGVRQNLGISRETTLLQNMHKLADKDTGRYAAGYSDAAAQARADKAFDQPHHGHSEE